MTGEITVPSDLWDDGSTGVISTWLFSSGDTVREGTVVAEVMNGKVSFEVTAPATGTLIIELPAEAELALGQRIGRIEAT
jgi:pyruvate/2-oxoglutarate dehydrogenase complex dihydrolipoamide acyltransferase (E2) component